MFDQVKLTKKNTASDGLEGIIYGNDFELNDGILAQSFK